MLASFDYHLRSTGPRVPARTPDRGRRRWRRARGPRPGARARRRRLALAAAGDSALQHQDPGVVRRPGPADREGRRAEDSWCSTSTSWRPRASAASSPSAAGRRTRRGCSSSSYTPAKSRRGTPHVVLVGKGVTFDSGGLSIKPGELMANMKRDMSGGAVVLAVLAALADVDCPVRVTGIIPLAENMISGDAMRPGDVITHYGGRTTEVTNTDAEGRLVLADGLAYAVSELEPDVLVDVATLTGAVRVALGQRIGGVFASDDALFGAAARRRCGGRRAAVAAAAGGRVRGPDQLQGRGRRQLPGQRPGDRRRAVPAALHRRPARGPTSTSPPWATRSTATSGPPARPGSAPARCSTGWSSASRSPA